jgi:GlcNAc-PI de-N-acetylase
MRAIVSTAVVALATLTVAPAAAQGTSKTLVAVFAHADDEGAVAPILARYTREGVQVYLLIATDGAAGGLHTEIPRGPELARARSEEARCATAPWASIHPFCSASRTASSATTLRIQDAPTGLHSKFTSSCNGSIPTP